MSKRPLSVSLSLRVECAEGYYQRTGERVRVAGRRAINPETAEVFVIDSVRNGLFTFSKSELAVG